MWVVLQLQRFCIRHDFILSLVFQWLQWMYCIQALSGSNWYGQGATAQTTTPLYVAHSMTCFRCLLGSKANRKGNEAYPNKLVAAWMGTLMTFFIGYVSWVLANITNEFSHWFWNETEFQMQKSWEIIFQSSTPTGRTWNKWGVLSTG